MVYVAIVSAFVLAAFVVFVVDIVKLIKCALKKQKPGKGLFASAIAFGCAWAVLGCLNLVLILGALSKGDPIIDKVLTATADVASKTLVFTFEGVEKNWDKNTLERAGQLGFSIVSSSKKDAKEKEKTDYEYKLLITNSLEKGKSISYWDLQSQNLLFALDANDVFYSARVVDATADRIPPGKSYLTVQVEVPAFTTLKELGLGEKKVKL
jgi:hypothetical protein